MIDLDWFLYVMYVVLFSFFYYLMVHSFVNAKVSHRSVQKKFKQNVRLTVFHFNVSVFSWFFLHLILCVACKWFIVHINLLVGRWNIFSIRSTVFALEITTFIHCWAKNFICGFWFWFCICMFSYTLTSALVRCNYIHLTVVHLFSTHSISQPVISIACRWSQYLSVDLDLYFGDFKELCFIALSPPWACVNKILTNHHCDLESYVAKQ